MTLGAAEYFEIKRLEERASVHGLVVSRCKHWHDRLALMIPDDLQDPNYALPVYCRGTELFTGTVSELLCYLHGWEKRREYEQLLRLDNNIQRRETAIRHRRTLDLLKKEHKQGES